MSENLRHWIDQNYSHLLEEYLQERRDNTVLGSWLVDYYPRVLKEWFQEGQ